ncbi:hypothetical protein TWF730_001424 [Orbilia blumenaviensis]|uniref:RRM domain-containing protein n=1 Tax=Orbilia blumenaviensis TaxID=1796055 RepID=A0AAV9UID7_9PEZI
MADSKPRRPRTRAPRTRVRKRDHTFKNLPDTDHDGTENNEEGGEGRGEEEEKFSIGGKDTTNEGIARSLKRKRQSNDDDNNDNKQEDGGNKNNTKSKGKEGEEDGKKKVQQVHNEAYSNLLKTAKNKKRKERRKNAAAAARAAKEGAGGENEKTGGDGGDGGDGDVMDVDTAGAVGDGDIPPADQKSSNEAAKPGRGGKKDTRFIVFVGNLPYTTTQATLTTHLSTVKPTGIRLATYKPGEKPKGRGFKPPKPATTEGGEAKDQPICKGYAFVEFPDAGRMKSCLSLFHHSEFEGRKINIELTAGGGGRNNDRKERVKAKNDSLNVERRKRYEEDKKKKLERGERVEEEKVEEEIEDGVHPSRRKRVRR